MLFIRLAPVFETLFVAADLSFFGERPKLMVTSTSSTRHEERGICAGHMRSPGQCDACPKGYVRVLRHLMCATSVASTRELHGHILALGQGRQTEPR